MKKITFLLFSLIIFSSCKTITVGKTGDVLIQANVSGATATIEGYGTFQLPATIALNKAEANYWNIEVCKKGYDCQILVVQRKSDWFGVLVGNALFGGLPGLIIDYGTGAAYELSTPTLLAALSKSEIEIEAALLEENTEDYIILTIFDIEHTPTWIAEGIIAEHQMTKSNRGIR
ncbi:hypothetical protein CL659_02965 [bacterium]|nr:hypothetical protein [bacterium]|tara:strand:- start:51217 stop:51741 length:525 start_codon:yes stop_codon:yes gene_type:complete